MHVFEANHLSLVSTRQIEHNNASADGPTLITLDALGGVSWLFTVGPTVDVPFGELAAVVGL